MAIFSNDKQQYRKKFKKKQKKQKENKTKYCDLFVIQVYQVPYVNLDNK